MSIEISSQRPAEHQHWRKPEGDFEIIEELAEVPAQALKGGDQELENIVRPVACRVCPNKFCVGCKPKKTTEPKCVRFIEILRFARNFKMLPGERNVHGAHPIPKAFTRPFTVPPGWSGSTVLSALTACNSIQGDISVKSSKKSAKVRVAEFE
jgi:hypothetical protein